MREPSIPCSGELFHAVHFYRDVDRASTTVGRFLLEGISGGQPGVVLARPEMREAIATSLGTLGLDVAAATADRWLCFCDAAQVLDSLLVDGRPDPLRTRQALESIIDFAHETPEGGTIRLYGELGPMLWQSGRRVAALELEDLAHAFPSTVMVLCGYPAPNPAESEVQDTILAFHSNVLTEAGELEAVV